MSSGPFPVPRGADAGQVVAITRVNDTTPIVDEKPSRLALGALGTVLHRTMLMDSPICTIRVDPLLG